MLIDRLNKAVLLAMPSPGMIDTGRDMKIAKTAVRAVLAQLEAEGLKVVPVDGEAMYDDATDAVGDAVKECLRMTDRHNERMGESHRFLWAGHTFLSRIYPSILASSPKIETIP